VAVWVTISKRKMNTKTLEDSRQTLRGYRHPSRGRPQRVRSRSRS
jgi:hypothetical protein